MFFITSGNLSGDIFQKQFAVGLYCDNVCDCRERYPAIQPVTGWHLQNYNHLATTRNRAIWQYTILLPWKPGGAIYGNGTIRRPDRKS